MWSRPRIAFALLLASVAALAWWLALDTTRDGSPAGPGQGADGDAIGDAQVSTAPADFAPGASHPTGPLPGPVSSRNDDTDPPGCAPTEERACHTGDVYIVDSCGHPMSKIEECGDSLCRLRECQRGDGSRCDGPPEGRCDGDDALFCVAGRPLRVDCAARGKRCVVGPEGAECRARSPDACERQGTLPRCEGPRLLHCVDGVTVSLDCQTLDPAATCGQIADRGRPRCLRLDERATAPRPDPACGPCGCLDGEPKDPLPSDLTEVCDGRDNDRDRLVDEEVDCGVVTLVPFLVASAGGASSYGPADLEAELSRVRAVLSTAPPGLALAVEWADPVYLRRADWLSLDGRELDELLRSPEVSAASDAFYVPVVFTDEILLNDTPKLGLATLPNGRCGGRRVDPHPVPRHGGVVVAKSRLPTTVAHELGHYLGLCHTHYDYDGSLARAVRFPVDEGRDAVQRCEPACSIEGDGICDTAPDPGPEQCLYDRACQVRCTTADVPDASNVMSYYSACRTGVSAEQARTMRHGLSLRRGYFRCPTPEACPCDPLSSACPEDMTCRPGPSGFACGLDGPRPQGAACQGHLECGGGALCASDGRCRRPCHPAQGHCPCQVDEGLGLRVCG